MNRGRTLLFFVFSLTCHHAVVSPASPDHQDVLLAGHATVVSRFGAVQELLSDPRRCPIFKECVATIDASFVNTTSLLYASAVASHARKPPAAPGGGAPGAASEQLSSTLEALSTSQRLDLVSTLRNTDRDPSLCDRRSLGWVREYADFHRRQLALSRRGDASVRFLVHECSDRLKDKRCGGVGDRLRGIVGAVMLASLTRRVLLVDHSRPAPLRDLLEPDEIEWDFDVAKHAPDAMRDATWLNCSEVRWVEQSQARRLIHTVADPRRRVVVMFAERFVLEGLTAALSNFTTAFPMALHSNQLVRSWMEETVTSPALTMDKQLFDSFNMTAGKLNALRVRDAEDLTSMKLSYPSLVKGCVLRTLFRRTREFNFFVELYKARFWVVPDGDRLAAPSIVGMHARRVVPEDVSLFAERGDAIERAFKLSHTLWYLASDSAHFEQVAKVRLGAKVFTLRHIPHVHNDAWWIEPRFYHLHWWSWLEHQLLMDADFLVYSHSGYSSSAKDWALHEHALRYDGWKREKILQDAKATLWGETEDMAANLDRLLLRMAHEAGDNPRSLAPRPMPR